MNQPTQQQPAHVEMVETPEYRESYANSIQVRMSLWDFFLLIGTIGQGSPDSITVRNFQGIYLSPQQAKALANVLRQNIAQYESTFGEITLGPAPPESGIQ